MLKRRILILSSLAFLSFEMLPQGPVLPRKVPASKPAPAVKPAQVQVPGTFTPAAVAPSINPAPIAGLKKPKLKWQSPAAMDLLNGENKKILHFDGAGYTKDFLPLYIERFALPSGENSANARIENEVYEVLDAGSSALLNKKTLQTRIIPKVSICYERKKASAEVTFVPLRLNTTTGQIERLISFDIKLDHSRDEARAIVNPRPQNSYVSNSVLATGTWYRIGVPSSGIYKITYQFLRSMGVNLKGLDLRQLKLYGNGGAMLPYQNSAFRYDDLNENPIYISGGASKLKMDSTDYILFYGSSPHTWTYNKNAPAGSPAFTHAINKYSDTTFYFLAVDLPGPSKRISSRPSVSGANKTSTTFDDFSYAETDGVNLILSGREWYGEKFDITTSYSYPFTFPNIDPSSPATLNVDVVGRTDADSTRFRVSSLSASRRFGCPPVSFASYWTDYATDGITSLSVPNPTSSLNVKVDILPQQSSGATSPLGWMNYVEVNARRQLVVTGSQMNFRDSKTAASTNITQFNLQGVTPRMQVWDVSDFKSITAQSGTYNTNSFSFTTPTDSLHEFVIFDTAAIGNLYTPVSFGPVPNQNLHATAEVDYIIVANPLFMSQATRLAALHATRENMSNVVVTPQQIYNEFSSGHQDPTAIRDFVKMLYDRSTGPATLPKYLLLFGDGSYDPKHRIQGNSNYIVAFENADALNYSDSYVSDEFFGLLDDTEGAWDSQNDIGAVDIGIGRFPVRTLDGGKGIVDKIEKYMSLGSPPPTTGCTAQNCSVMSDWRNWVAFMADDGDGAAHLLQAEQLTTMIDTGFVNYNIDKIYLDAYQEEMTPGGGRYPGVVDAINKRIEKGALIFNYTGHGGTVGLSHKRVVEDQQINNWTNLCNLPFFVTATCEFAQYDDPANVSAGELILLNPNGGGIGLFTTVRLVFSYPNFNLNQNFYRYAFKPIGGVMPRLGDIYRQTKVASGNLVNNRNFSLLADPALQLAYPKENAKTTSVNGVTVTSTSVDTVHALSRVTVNGFVCDSAGQKLSTFNGTIYPTVFDKASYLTTLSNDGASASPPITFKLQKNVIYKGKSTVANGNFQFSFVVPKDIAYQYGSGRISYYFENGVIDGAGCFKQFTVGGSAPNAQTDVIGPKVRLFLNDSSFQFGGTTSQDPRLFAILFDSSGVNTVGNGIGHDITAILDENSSNPTVLNDYYSADLNTYRSGKVNFPYAGLSEGRHTLRMKVWDVYDNSSQSYTEFVVSSSAQLALKHVLNYPNPFTTHTSFFFEDNECCQTLNVEIEIFTVTGKLVKTISTNVYAEGYRSPPIEWDGRDDFGDKIGRGVYVYKLTVHSQAGGTTEKLEKLVILN
jgi:hypothetical protein